MTSMSTWGTAGLCMCGKWKLNSYVKLQELKATSTLFWNVLLVTKSLHINSIHPRFLHLYETHSSCLHALQKKGYVMGQKALEITSSFIASWSKSTYLWINCRSARQWSWQKNVFFTNTASDSTSTKVFSTDCVLKKQIRAKYSYIFFKRFFSWPWQGKPIAWLKNSAITGISCILKQREKKKKQHYCFYHIFY